VVDEDRHFDWHAAIKDGAGRALEYRPDYEVVGFIDAPDDVEVLALDELVPDLDID